MNIILFEENEWELKASDERYQHIKKVLHLAEGDSFRAGVIDGPMGLCHIESMTPEKMVLSFEKKSEREPLFPLTMIIAQVRPICMRRILRETVSLGVGHLILPVSDLGEKSYLSASLYTTDEYRSILIDGAMQAGKSTLPEIEIVGGVEEALKLASGEKILLDNVIGSVPLSSMSFSGPVTLAIGPERGWTERERRLFMDNGYRPCLIGSRILRTETASVAGAAMALSAMHLL